MKSISEDIKYANASSLYTTLFNLLEHVEQVNTNLDFGVETDSRSFFGPNRGNWEEQIGQFSFSINA